MAYIGAQPNKQLTKTTSQSFNGTGSATAFTLNRAVNTGEELEVFVDNVQQEPGSGKSYTATGTTLTFDEAPPSGTGNVYVIYRGQAEVTTRLEHDPNQALSATTGTFTSLNVPTIKDSSGTNTAMTIDSSGRILTPARPAFKATRASASNQTTADAYVVYPWDTAPINIGGHYNTSTYAFTTPVAGLYQFSYILRLDDAQGGSFAIANLSFDGSTASDDAYNVAHSTAMQGYYSFSGSALFSLSAGVEVKNVVYVNGDTSWQAKGHGNFSGFLVG